MTLSLKYITDVFDLLVVTEKTHLHKIVVVILVSVLTACGSAKVEVTADDSADYKSAKQLPPLKKNTKRSSAPNVFASANNTSNGGSTLVEPEARKSIATQPSNNASQITVSLVDRSKNAKRIKIDADLDAAWNYLLSDLRSSTVTVHSRNKAAARIEVGCGEIDDGLLASERDGWKIFNKGDLVSEYCVMQLTESKGSTLVSLLNRHGNEVSSADALTIFNQFLKK